jgi:hypothetical protein
MFRSFKFAVAWLFIFVSLVLAASAQIGGSAWKPFTVSFKVQSPTNVPQSARYFFTNNIYHCLVFSNDGAFSVGNTTKPRTEQRFNPDYTSGEIQYQSVMMCPSNENSYCCFQIHTGDAQSPTFGSTTFMLFWFSSDGGSVHDYSGTELAKNLGNQWFQLNVDHNIVTGTIRVWVNQKLVWTQQDNGAKDFYFKDGVYEQDHGPTLQMDTYITNSIKMWVSSGTNPPAAPTGLTTMPTITQIGLNWNSSVGATNYNLKRSTINGSSYTTIASLTGTSYIDSNVTNGTTYYYVVTAMDNFGESLNSTQVSASLINTGYQLVATPSSLSMAAGNSTNFTVAMTTNSTFNGNVLFGVAGLPAGASANFSPPSLGAPGTSTLTVNTISNTAGGNYTLTIAGTDGSFVVTTNVTLSLSGVAANPGKLLWTAGGADTNWSTVLNWTNLTTGGNGPPGPANNLVFTNTAAVNSSGTINNVVDDNFTVESLQFNNNAASTSPNYQVTLISDGQTLVVTNGISVSTAADSDASQVVNAAITGANGTLILNNGVVAITQGSGSDGAHQAILDLSGLGTLNIINASKIAVAVNGVPAQAGNGGQRSSGVLYLAMTNFISVTSTGVTNGIVVGWNDSQGNGSSSGVPNAADKGSALYLGQTNAIFTDAVYVGTDKTLGCLLAFNPNGLNNPTAYFRGIGGATSRVSLWGIGDTSMKNNSNQSASGTNDFTGGMIDALVGNMNVGVSEAGASSGNTGNGSGILTFNEGIIDVNNLTNGWSVGTGTNTSDVGSGTINVNDTATLRVNRVFALAMNTGTGTGVPSGTLNITDGTVLATNIIGGSGVSTINLNSGTLDLQSDNPAPGKIANISTLNIGANAVDDPALLANATAISAANAIVIAPNGTLAGNTVITSPGLTVNGAISPGADGVGAMTNNGPITLGAGGEYVVTVQDAAAGPGAGWSFLQASKGINVQATSGNPFTIALQTATGPAANFNSSSNYDWIIATANNGITNFNTSAFTVDSSLFQNDLAAGFFYVRTNAGSLVLSFTNNLAPFTPPVAVYIATEANNLVFSGSNGTPATPYYLLASTNLSLPATNWTVVATNSFDANGGFNFTNAMDPGQPQEFFQLQLK